MLAMPTTSNPPRSSRVLGRTDTPLTLLVRGGEHNGRTVRITSPKCSIGSARGCTFRLQAVGIRPVHCWILRGTRSTVLQAWSADVHVNGIAVREACLRPGDRLRIGPLEFEVLTASSVGDIDYAAANGPTPAELSQSPLRNSDVPRRRLEDKLQVAEETLQQREAEIDELRRSAQAQVDQHRDAFELLRNERDELQSQLNREQIQWQAERAALDSQLAGAAKSLDQDRSQAEESRKRAFDEAKQLAGSLLESSNELRQLRESVQTQRDEFQSQRLELQSSLATAQALAEERRQQLEANRADASQQSAGMTKLITELRGELQQLQSQHSASHEEATTLRTRLEAELAALTQQHTQTIAEIESQYKSQLCELQQRCTSGVEEVARVRSELSQSHAQRDELATTLELLTEQLQNREADLATQCGQVATLQAQFAAEKTALEQLAAEWEGRCHLSGYTVDEIQALSAAEIDQLRTTLATIEAERDSSHANIALLTEQLRDCESQLAAQTDETKSLQMQLDAAQDKLSQQTREWELRLEAKEHEVDQRQTISAAELSGIRSAMSAAEVDRDSLQSRYEKLREQLQSREAQLAALSEQAGATQTQFTYEQESLAQQVANWEVRYENREQEFADAQAQSDAELKRLRADLATVEADRDSLQDRINQLETRSAQVQAELEQLTAEKVTLAEQAAQWKARVTEVEQLADEQSDLHVGELSRLQADVTAAQTEGTQLQLERSALLEEQTVLQGKCANLTRQIQSLESDLAAERAASCSDTADQGSMTLLIPRAGAMSDDAAALEKERANWEVERRAWDEQRAELESQTAALWEDLAQFEAVQQQLVATQADAQEKQSQLQQLQEQLSADHSSAAAWNQQRTELESELAERTAQIEQLTVQWEQAQEQLATLERETTLLRERLDSRGDDLSADRAELEALRQSLAEEKARLAALQQNANDDLSLVDERQAESQREFEAWESLLKDKEESLQRRDDVLAEQSIELSTREAELNRQLAEVAAQLAAMDAHRSSSDPLADDELPSEEQLGDELSSEPASSDAVPSERQEEALAATLVGPFDLDLISPRADDSELVDDASELSTEAGPDECDSLQDEPAAVEASLDESEFPAAEANVEVESILARLAEAGLLKNSPVAEPDSDRVEHEPIIAETSEEPEASEQEVRDAVEPQLADEQTEEEPEAASDEAPESDIRSTAALPTTFNAGAAEDDDSIESYMSQLLKRVRGEEAYVHSTSVLSSKSRPDHPSNVIAKPVAPPPPPVNQDTVPHAEYKPRSHAPEQSGDVAAMRELANSAARMAISTHASKHQGKQAAGKLIAGAIVSTVAFVAFAFWSFRAGSLLAIGGMLGSVAAAGYFGVQIAIVSCNFLRLARPTTPVEADSTEK